MKKIAEMIEYEGDNSVFVWKHPCEDFNNLTQLIVHESQEALFFKNGQALDLLGSGHCALETQNIPMLSKVFNRLTGDDTPFHCEVYFINKTVQMAIKWGVDSKIRFLDPKYGVPLEIGISGELNLMVSDSRKLITKLVGTMNGIAWDDRGDGFTKSLAESFRPLISAAVKSRLPNCIKDMNINILDIDRNLETLAEELRKSILPGFEKYGLNIPEFYVTTIVLPESDPNFQRIREIYTISVQKAVVKADAEVKTAMAESAAAVTAAERQVAIEEEKTVTEKARYEVEREVMYAQGKAQQTKLSGLAEAEVMRAKGYTEKDVLQAEVQKAYAEGLGNMTISGSGGGVAGDMISLGVGMAAAGAVSEQIGEAIKGMGPTLSQEVPQPAKIICRSCESSIPEDSNYCYKCGAKVEVLSADEVICPACGEKVNKGNFCRECGASLVSQCPKCGAEIVSGSKFCAECGEKL